MALDIEFTESVFARAKRDAEAWLGKIGPVALAVAVGSYPVSRMIPDNQWYSPVKDSWPIGAVGGLSLIALTYLINLPCALCRQRAEARAKLKQLSDTAPRIRLADPSIEERIVPMTVMWTGIPRPHHPVFFQVMFANVPTDGGTTEAAKNVAARVTFASEGTDKLSVWGRWSHLEEPGAAGKKDFDPTINRCDIEPNKFPVKLDIAFWHPGTSCGYVHNNTSMMMSKDLNDFCLLPGEHRIKVELSGQRVNETFWLKLLVPGDNKKPTLSIAE